MIYVYAIVGVTMVICGIIQVFAFFSWSYRILAIECVYFFFFSVDSYCLVKKFLANVSTKKNAEDFKKFFLNLRWYMRHYMRICRFLHSVLEFFELYWSVKTRLIFRKPKRESWKIESSAKLYSFKAAKFTRLLLDMPTLLNLQFS